MHAEVGLVEKNNKVRVAGRDHCAFNAFAVGPAANWGLPMEERPSTS